MVYVGVGMVYVGIGMVCVGAVVIDREKGENLSSLYINRSGNCFYESIGTNMTDAWAGCLIMVPERPPGRPRER
jgi:hypothetical protein